MDSAQPSIVLKAASPVASYELWLPCADIGTTPSGFENDYMYTGTGSKAPLESGVIATVAAFGRVWAPYYDPTWVLTLQDVWSGGSPASALPVRPSAPNVLGSTMPAQVTDPPLKRGFSFRSILGNVQRLRLFYVPINLIGVARMVTAHSGGFDGRDQAFVAYLSGVATGLVCWDGQPYPPSARVYIRRQQQLTNATPGIVGSGVDESGALATDCLMFPHGQGICGDVTATLRFLMGDGQDHGMDDTGYTLPGGHRLERVPG